MIIPNADWRRAYDQIQFAPARRIGDALYVSGVIVARFPGEGADAAAFEAQVRRAFRRIDGVLRAAGVDMNAVAIINSFHVWEGPDFNGGKDDQIAIINKVKAEFITGPHPAWTAVGVTGLLGQGGIVEIQAIAYVGGAIRRLKRRVRHRPGRVVRRRLAPVRLCRIRGRGAARED